MGFRIKAFAAHVGLSACVLALLLSVLLLGWYRWPGWYVTGFVHVAAILLAVDVTMGPLFTLLVASPKKPRAVLARDVAVIVTLQLVALSYGVATLWEGRPLYYAYSTKELQTVAASQVSPSEADLGRRQNPDFAPHWYSLPRWVFARMPVDQAERTRIEKSARDIVQMPRFYQALSQGGDVLRAQLGTVDSWFIFTRREKQLLKQRMSQRGLPTDQPDTLYLIGQDRPVLAVFDRATLKLVALIRAN